MNVNLSRIPKDPYLGFDVKEAIRAARLCAECPYPAPCQVFCSQGVNIPKIMYHIGLAACEGLTLSRWLLTEDEVETARITDQLCDSYN